jgi:tyrosyl-DNA phosphodiesterase-1
VTQRLSARRQMIIGVLGQTGGMAKGRPGRRTNAHDSDEDSDEIVEVAPPQPYGWAYVGSHNFTPSAWGTLSGSAFNPTLNVRHGRVYL